MHFCHSWWSVIIRLLLVVLKYCRTILHWQKYCDKNGSAIFCVSLIRCMMVTTWTSLWLGCFVEGPSLPILYQLETSWWFTLSLMARYRNEASMRPTALYQVRRFLLSLRYTALYLLQKQGFIFIWKAWTVRHHVAHLKPGVQETSPGLYL